MIACVHRKTNCKINGFATTIPRAIVLQQQHLAPLRRRAVLLGLEQPNAAAAVMQQSSHYQLCCSATTSFAYVACIQKRHHAFKISCCVFLFVCLFVCLIRGYDSYSPVNLDQFLFLCSSSFIPFSFIPLHQIFFIISSSSSFVPPHPFLCIHFSSSIPLHPTFSSFPLHPNLFIISSSSVPVLSLIFIHSSSSAPFCTFHPFLFIPSYSSFILPYLFFFICSF